MIDATVDLKSVIASPTNSSKVIPRSVNLKVMLTILVPDSFELEGIVEG